MPLVKGKSDKVISENIAELMSKWETTGTIGNSSPKNRKEAKAMAVAIALQNAGKTKRTGE